MALYLISYDIAEKDAFEYKGLWACLEELGAVRILYSEWILGTNMAIEDIFNKIAQTIQQKDRLLVQEVGGTAWWDKLLITDERFGSILRQYARL